MLVFGAHLYGASYYTARPDDPAAVDLSKEGFPGLQGDGIGDDTITIEGAISKVTQTPLGKGVVLVPAGRYRISHTIQIPPGVRLIGYGPNRPVFVLGPDTPGFQEGEGKYMVWFTGGSGGRAGGVRDASPGTFYSALANIDFEIQDGNPAAVGIRAYYAQHCYLAHIDFHTGSGLAGIGQADNEAEDLHFYGGDYGIMTRRPSPSWQFTLLDSAFEGQRKAAIKSREGGLTLVRDQFRNVPTAISIDEDYAEELWMKDCRLEDISGPALIISNEKNAQTEISLENVACDRVPTLAAFRESGKRVVGPGVMYVVNEFSHGLNLGDLGRAPEVKTVCDARPAASLPPAVASDIPSLPGVETWANVRSFGAKGDGEADDLPAFKAAIAQAKVIFVPSGRYRVSNSIQLAPDTVLVGLHPLATQICILDGETNFTGAGEYKGVVESSGGGNNIIQGIGLDSAANNVRAVALKWMAGAGSMVNDVKLLGGHGTYRPDGTRLSPYNAGHTGDSNPKRIWDSDGPGLLVTRNGGGTFADVWTASTFSACGMMIENTTNSGRIYELSSEHHVRNEIILHNASHWQIYALQTEAEWGEGSRCLPVEIRDCADVTFANLFMFRVVAMPTPYECGAKINASKDIRFRNVHVYSQSKFSFDDPVCVADYGCEIRQREIGSLDISGAPPERSSRLPKVVASGARVEKLAGGFESIDCAVAVPSGDVCFLDNHLQKIYRWSPESRALTLLPNNGLAAASLAMDRAGHLLIVSRSGTVYAMNLADTNDAPAALKSVAAAARPGMTVIVPGNRWYDWHTFVEDTLRKQSNHFISPDGTTFIPAPDGFLHNNGRPPGIPPIDLLRTYGLTSGDTEHPVYVSDEHMHKTWRFTVEPDGSLSNPKLFADEGEAGSVVDERGNVYIAAGNVFVFDAAGKGIGLIEVPERPTSLAFGEKDHKTLFITARVPGVRYFTPFARSSEGGKRAIG